MSGLGVALLFAYLAVRPTVQVRTADGGRLGADQPTTAVKVESVRQGDLVAKMQAKNQCASSNGWRVLLGFYVTASAWKKGVRPIGRTECTPRGAASTLMIAVGATVRMIW